jgi:hypothetical protein
MVTVLEIVGSCLYDAEGGRQKESEAREAVHVHG